MVLRLGFHMTKKKTYFRSFCNLKDDTAANFMDDMIKNTAIIVMLLVSFLRLYQHTWGLIESVIT